MYLTASEALTGSTILPIPPLTTAAPSGKRNKSSSWPGIGGLSIVRTSIVYGWPHPGKRNFVPWLIGHLDQGQPYYAPTDVYRTPVYVRHLVEGVATLVDGHFPGIHHIAGRDWVTMMTFAQEVANSFGLDRNLVVPKAEPAARSERLGLDCAATTAALGMPVRG